MAKSINPEEIDPHPLVVSSEAAAIAEAYDRMVAFLDRPVLALERFILRIKAAHERFRLWMADLDTAVEQRRVQRRVMANVIKQTETKPGGDQS